VSVAAWCLGVDNGSGNGDDGDDGNGDVMRWQGVMTTKQGSMATKQGCALPRWGDEMTACDGDATKWGCMQLTTLVPAQLLNSLPTLGLHCKMNESASLAGPTEKSGGGGVSAVANAPVSPVSPNALRLAGIVVNAAQMGSQTLRH